MAYGMMYPFIIPTLLYVYAGAVQDHWGNCVSTGVYMLSQWSKFSLRVVAHHQRNPYKNCNDDEDIDSCECTKELFVNSLDTAITKKVEEEYETLDGIEQGGITYLDFSLDDMFNMSDVVITFLQELLKLLVEHINAVKERLTEVPELSRDIPFLVFNGFTK